MSVALASGSKPNPSRNCCSVRAVARVAEEQRASAPQRTGRRDDAAAAAPRCGRARAARRPAGARRGATRARAAGPRRSCGLLQRLATERAGGSRPRASARRARRAAAAGRRRGGGARRRCATTSSAPAARVVGCQTRPRASSASSRGVPANTRLAVAQHDDAPAQRGDVLGLVRGEQHRAVLGRGARCSSRKRSRCSGSRPAVGSSRMSSRGSPSSAWASATRRRMPPDSALIAPPHDVVEPDEREHAADLVVALAAHGQLLEDRDVVDELERGEALVEAGLLGHVAEPAADRGPLARGRRGRGRAAAAGPRRARAPWRGSA